MPIIKSAPRTEYTVIPNSTLQDKRLSFDERGVLAYLISRPSTWEISPSDLSSQGGIGRQKVYRILAHLIECGYCTREEIRDKGKFIDTVYTVFDTPQNQPCDEKPHTEKPDTVNHTQVSKESLVIQETTPPNPQRGNGVALKSSPPQSPLKTVVLTHLFNFKSGKTTDKALNKRADKIVTALAELDVDADQLIAFVAWWRKEHPTLTTPRNTDTVLANVSQWLNARPAMPRRERA